ncbi:MAG: endonuclease/exonuclease/phosphatase family metal-dependent hydrolase [Lentimonas sp.]|jgi:endonuclease/exonuclease/phosphatase family metal-dependent hydrolase
MYSSWQQLKVGCIAILLFHGLAFGESLRLATYNLNNYLVMDRYANGAWRKSYPKPESEKAVIREVIKQAMPDILALQEIGPRSFLKELKADLAQEGVEYPHSVIMQGDDSVRHLAVLSKVAPIEVIQHQDLEIEYQNKREFVKRGMLELSFERTSGDVFKLFVVHLKSRRTNVKSDPQSLRRRTLEAEACRNRIIERTFEMGITDFVIAGDFNDHPESAPLRRFYKRGDLKIGIMVPVTDSRGERWTHYYGREVVYSLVDGFITSKSFFRQIENKCGHIVDTPDVLKGSDHRMVYLDLIQP